MIVAGDRSRVFPVEGFFDTLLDGLEGIVIAARGKSIAMLVLLAAVRVPAPCAHALDQLRTDTVALDRKGVIRVAYVDSFHLPEIALNILRVTGGRRKSRSRSR